MPCSWVKTCHHVFSHRIDKNSRTLGEEFFMFCAINFHVCSPQATSFLLDWSVNECPTSNIIPSNSRTFGSNRMGSLQDSFFGLGSKNWQGFWVEWVLYYDFESAGNDFRHFSEIEKKSIEHLSNLLPRDYFSTSFSTMQISSFPNLAILETPHFHWGRFQLSREEFRHDPRRKNPKTRGLAANNTRSRSALMASGMFIKCQPGTWNLQNGQNSSGILFFVYMDVSKNLGKPPPNHPFVHRVFHYFRHPFWGFSPYFWKHPYI